MLAVFTVCNNLRVMDKNIKLPKNKILMLIFLQCSCGALFTAYRGSIEYEPCPTLVSICLPSETKGC